MKVTPFMRERIVEIISCLFIVLFVYASLTKLFDYQKFITQIGQSPVLTNISGTLAWLVPAVELLISILLIFQSTRRYGIYASLSLMVMFTTYIILATRFSDFVPCSCGGVIEVLTWNQHLILNTGLIVIAVVAIFMESELKERVMN